MDSTRSTTGSQPLVADSTAATSQARPYGRQDWNEQERAAVALAQAAVASHFGSAPVWQRGTLAVMEALLAQLPGHKGAYIELVAREAGMSVDGQLMPLLSHLSERFPELVTRQLVAPDGQVIAPWNLNKMIAQQPDPNWVETVVVRWSPGPGIRQMQSERALQSQDTQEPANDEADEATYLVAEDWDDLGRTVRFVFDTKANALVAAQSRSEAADGQPQWHALSWQRQRELEQSLKDNLGLSDPLEMGLSECNEPPAWAASLIEQQAQPEIDRPRQRP